MRGRRLLVSNTPFSSVSLDSVPGRRLLVVITCASHERYDFGSHSVEHGALSGRIPDCSLLDPLVITRSKMRVVLVLESVRGVVIVSSPKRPRSECPGFPSPFLLLPFRVGILRLR